MAYLFFYKIIYWFLLSIDYLNAPLYWLGTSQRLNNYLILGFHDKRGL